MEKHYLKHKKQDFDYELFNAVQNKNMTYNKYQVQANIQDPDDE